MNAIHWPIHFVRRRSAFRCFLLCLGLGRAGALGGGMIEFQFADFQAQETDAFAYLIVNRTGDTSGTDSVDFATSDATAVAGQDYAATSGRLTFTNGEITHQIAVPIFNDGLVEGDESFIVTLNNPSPGATLGTLASRALTIIDNDQGVEFSATNYFASERARQAVLRVGRRDDGTNAIFIHYSTASGSALPGTDFVGVTNGLITLNPGAMDQLLIIPLISDTEAEPPEDFRVFLHDPGPGAALGTVTQAVVRVLDSRWPGQVDGSFDARLRQEYDGVHNLRLMADGRVVIDQFFWIYIDGVLQNGIVRLLPNGALDPSFQAEHLPHNGYWGLAVQPDGKVLYGSAAYMPDGAIGARSLRRLQASGSCDPTFAESCDGPILTGFWTGTGYAVVVQPDGKILLGGDLWDWSSGAPFGLARYETNGALDPNFNRGLPSGVKTITLQSDGKILVGGTDLLVRLNINGTVNAGFNAPLNVGFTNQSSVVWAIVAQPDGGIIVGGSFVSVSGALRTNLTRLQANGAPDPTWSASAGTDGEVRALALQANGRVVVGGDFTQLNGASRNRIGRLNRDGTLDASFLPGEGADGPVNTMAVQPDGGILAGGGFANFDGLPMAGLVRLTGDAIPRFGPSERGSDGFHLTLACDPGQRIEMQYSTNLTGWTAIQTNLTSSDSLQVTDPDGLGGPRRFYRAVVTAP